MTTPKFEFPLLEIAIVSSADKTNKLPVCRNDFRWLGLNVTPEELRASIWEDIKKERTITQHSHQSKNLKLLRRISENPRHFALVLGGFESEHLQVIIRACSFLAHLETLNPMNYIFSDDERFQSPMTQDEYYELLKSLGIKLNLIKR